MEQTYIAIMIQSLEKKEQVLDKIIELDTVQKNQLEDPNLTPDDFDDVVEQKSKLIEQLDNLDSGFEKLFERVKEELEGNKETYKEEIRIMQDHIRKITDNANILNEVIKEIQKQGYEFKTLDEFKNSQKYLKKY